MTRTEWTWKERRCGFCAGSGTDWALSSPERPRPSCGNCAGTGIERYRAQVLLGAEGGRSAPGK